MAFGDGAEQWRPPSDQGIKVNVDAAIFTNTQQFRSGFVARYDNGLLIEGGTQLWCGRIDPILAEAVGMREVLSWIKAKHWNKVYVESDCLALVQALRSNVDMISSFGRVISACRALLLDLPNVSISFVKRL